MFTVTRFSSWKLRLNTINFEIEEKFVVILANLSNGTAFKGTEELPSVLKTS